MKLPTLIAVSCMAALVAMPSALAQSAMPAELNRNSAVSISPNMLESKSAKNLEFQVENRAFSRGRNATGKGSRAQVPNQPAVEAPAPTYRVGTSGLSIEQLQSQGAQCNMQHYDSIDGVSVWKCSTSFALYSCTRYHHGTPRSNCRKTADRVARNPNVDPFKSRVFRNAW